MPLEKGIEAEWVDGHEKPHGDPVLDQDEENAEAIDDGFTGCKLSKDLSLLLFS